MRQLRRRRINTKHAEETNNNNEGDEDEGQTHIPKTCTKQLTKPHSCFKTKCPNKAANAQENTEKHRIIILIGS